MRIKQTNQQIRQQMQSLAQDLIKIGLATSDAGIMVIGNTIQTVLSAEAQPDTRAMQDLVQTLEEFCIRQIKREQGMTDAEIAIDELFSMKCNLN